VERAGRQLRVMVRVNDVVEAPFYIDTGASRVLVPRWIVEEADIDLEGARTMIAGTANGLVEVPVVTLDSVDLHGARVERVPAAVSDSMQVGLLGLSFLNHFEYAVDPAAGVVTLRENDLGRVGVIPGEVD
jgi:clan AA aspartic protease (TIGR02281 family)